MNVPSRKGMSEYAFGLFISLPQAWMKGLSYNTEGIVMTTLVGKTSQIQFLLDTVVSTELVYFKEVMV